MTLDIILGLSFLTLLSLHEKGLLGLVYWMALH